MAAVVLLGAPALAVLIFEVLLNATSMFSHGNARMPARLDRVLRLFVVTPDMHRVHHSIHPTRRTANFGFNPRPGGLPVRHLQGPAGPDGHEGMTIRLEQFRDERTGGSGCTGMLLLPFAWAGSAATRSTGRGDAPRPPSPDDRVRPRSRRGRPEEGVKGEINRAILSPLRR